MYNAFWRLALFVRGQSFSVKTFNRSRNGCQVIREGAGNDFRGPSVQALPLPSRSPSRAPVFSCAHYLQAPATQAIDKVAKFTEFNKHVCGWEGESKFVAGPHRQANLAILQISKRSFRWFH